MPAHLRDIVPPRCGECDKPATVEVRNTQNERIGDFCRRHGIALVDELRKEASR